MTGQTICVELFDPAFEEKIKEKVSAEYIKAFPELENKFSHVVFCGSARRLEESFSFLAEEGLQDAFQITYTSVMEVAVGFKNWKGRPLDGFGALMPSKEKRKILGILFLSSLFSGRAPKGGAMLSVFMGGYLPKICTSPFGYFNHLLECFSDLLPH